MQTGKRSAAWDHTAALIAQLRAVHGDKEAALAKYHPYLTEVVQAEMRKAFKALSKSEQEARANGKRRSG
jgi:hypothetical protein